MAGHPIRRFGSGGFHEGEYFGMMILDISRRFLRWVRDGATVLRVCIAGAICIALICASSLVQELRLLFVWISLPFAGFFFFSIFFSLSAYRGDLASSYLIGQGEEQKRIRVFYSNVINPDGDIGPTGFFVVKELRSLLIADARVTFNGKGE